MIYQIDDLIEIKPVLNVGRRGHVSCFIFEGNDVFLLDPPYN